MEKLISKTAAIHSIVNEIESLTPYSSDKKKQLLPSSDSE